MLKDVVISMATIQDVDSSDPDVLEFSTDGFYKFEDNIGCISYMESPVTGMEGTQTSVIVMPDQVIVDRDGTVTSRMVFKEGEKNSFLYDTPFGKATMGIRTRHLKHEFNEDGGNFEVEYDVDVEHKLFTKNRFTLNVRQENNRSITGGFINA